MVTFIRREVNQYLKEKRCDIMCDPLDYWKANKMLYPRLASLAHKYHSIPPGSAAPERLFSTAKQILKPTRLNMKLVNLESNMFLKRNFELFDTYESCPDGFTAPNSADIPSLEYGPVDDDDSELSDICNITDDEDDVE